MHTARPLQSRLTENRGVPSVFVILHSASTSAILRLAPQSRVRVELDLEGDHAFFEGAIDTIKDTALRERDVEAPTNLPPLFGCPIVAVPSVNSIASPTAASALPIAFRCRF
jgi:hypothetical protein